MYFQDRKIHSLYLYIWCTWLCETDTSMLEIDIEMIISPY